jgi:hypothetical protein
MEEKYMPGAISRDKTRAPLCAILLWRGGAPFHTSQSVFLMFSWFMLRFVSLIWFFCWTSYGWINLRGQCPGAIVGLVPWFGNSSQDFYSFYAKNMVSFQILFWKLRFFALLHDYWWPWSSASPSILCFVLFLDLPEIQMFSSLVVVNKFRHMLSYVICGRKISDV